MAITASSNFSTDLQIVGWLFTFVRAGWNEDHLSLKAGQSITPATNCSSMTNEIKVPKSCLPARKLLVPSIGSMYQVIFSVPVTSLYSSPTML